MKEIDRIHFQSREHKVGTMRKLLDFLFPFWKAYVTLWVKPLMERMGEGGNERKDYTDEEIYNHEPGDGGSDADGSRA